MSSVNNLVVCRVVIALVLGIASLIPASAVAGPLPANFTQYPAIGEPDPVGSPLLVLDAPTITTPFSSPVFTGTLTSMVVRNDANNPWGLDKLTFLYQVANDAGSINELHRLTVSSFDGYLADASYQTSVAGLIPAFIDRNVGGDTVGFSFHGFPFGPGGITPGTTTAWLVVQTNSTKWAPVKASVIDGAVASADSYAPAPVPEPSTLALLASLALGGWCFLGRRAS